MPNYQAANMMMTFVRPTAFLLLAAVLSGAGCAADGLEKNLQARLAVGELGAPPCAPVTSNLRPVDQGFDDIRFDAVPGAHRVVVVPSSAGWRMAFGVPELTVFTQAGFYTMKERTFIASDGIERPAREYRLTPKGFMAMAGVGANCFDYLSYRSVELISDEEIPMPPRLSGLGAAYRVKYKLRVSEPAEWAGTPEFKYVFTKILTVGRDAAWAASKQQILIHSDGTWLSEREAMTTLLFDAATLQRPQMRGQLAHQRDQMMANTAERKAERVARLAPADIRAKLVDDKHRAQIAACLQLPLYEADLTSGFWKSDAPASFVFYDDAARRDKSRYDHAIEFVRRLEKAGLAKAETFNEEPFAGARKGAGVRYLLSEAAAAALERPRMGCLPLGEARLDRLRIVATTAQGVAFRGWAHLVEPRPWTAALAMQFPNVKSILEIGYGFSGSVQLTDEEPVQVQVRAPVFGLKAAMRPFNLAPPIARTGLAVVDLLPDGAVRMQAPGCTISADGTEVAVGRVSCGTARASRGFRAGRAYAEITFRGKQKGAHPDTWTNAAVTSQRSLYSLSTGAALFSFAGSYTKQQIKDGDLIGIALDMDAQVLYWRLNGEWVTGRPGSGIGEPMIDTGQEYFIAVSVQDKAEGWRVNFGATPFRFPPPEGFPAYGAPRKL